MKKMFMGGLASLAFAAMVALSATPAAAFWLQNNSSYTVTEVYVINHDGSWTQNYLRSGGYFIPDDGGEIPKTAHNSCYYDVVVHDPDGYEAYLSDQNLCSDAYVAVYDEDFDGGDY